MTCGATVIWMAGDPMAMIDDAGWGAWVSEWCRLYGLMWRRLGSWMVQAPLFCCFFLHLTLQLVFSFSISLSLSTSPSFFYCLLLLTASWWTEAWFILCRTMVPCDEDSQSASSHCLNVYMLLCINTMEHKLGMRGRWDMMPCTWPWAVFSSYRHTAVPLCIRCHFCCCLLNRQMFLYGSDLLHFTSSIMYPFVSPFTLCFVFSF